jgi:hypothetical protein
VDGNAHEMREQHTQENEYHQTTDEERVETLKRYRKESIGKYKRSPPDCLKQPVLRDAL